jgi:hypothetical protein
MRGASPGDGLFVVLVIEKSKPVVRGFLGGARTGQGLVCNAISVPWLVT